MSQEQEASIELGATLLLSSSSSNSTNKYKKKWRSLYLGVLISVKWPTTSRPLSSSEPPARTKSRVVIDVDEEVIEEEEEEEEEEERIRRIARIVKEQDLNSLHDLGGIEFVSTVLARQRQSQPSQSEEDTVPVLGITSFRSFLFQSCKCNGYTILMLLISAVLSFAIGFRQEGPKHGWHDGVAIVCAVVLLLARNSVANFWRERKMLKLARRRNKVKFDVQRGEESLVVPLSNIMVGDKVSLGPGAEVPAYGLLVSDGILEVAEGEVTKKERGNPFLKSGSKVIGGGHGLMLVTSVESSMSYSVERRGGLLESLIEKPISDMDKVALFISVVVIFVVFIRLICKKDDGGNSGLPEMKGKVSVELLREVLERGFLRPQGRVSTLTGLVTVVILSVQHGMPLVVTISLMYKIKKVVSKSNQKVVLNDLSACTTMGLVTVICIDASGGLISKPMEVSRIWMGDEDIITSVEGSETNQVVLDMLKQGVAVLDPELSLSPICGSLVSWAEAKWEMNMKSFPGKFVILKRSKLNSDKEGGGVLVRKVVGNEKDLYLHWSGEACTILEMCSKYYDSEGQCHAMENKKIKFGEMIKEMEDGGLKSIAFAYRETKVEELEQDELILLGVIGLKVEHTCQESTKSALEYLRNTANIHIKLVSEDNIMGLKEIACELGIEVPPDCIVLEGKELQDLNDEAGSEKVDQALLMGSFCHQDKHRMVKCLQKKGHVVALIQARLMTSNTSDLELEADVGIVHDSLRIANRDSFGICIKCFSGLKPIVLAGRSLYLNIQKFIQLQLTITISGLVITLITTICSGDSPLTAFQLIWVNVLMSPLGGLMMVMELTSEEKLVKQPSNRTHRSGPIVTKKMGKNIVIQVLYQVSVSMILEFGGHVTDTEKRVRKTMIFNTFLICQLFNQLNTMQLLKMDVLKIVLQSYYFLVALGGCILMHVLVIEYAKGLSDCMRLNAAAWAICVLVGAFSWVVDWALKKILVIFSTNSSSQSNTSPSQSNTSPSFHLYTFYLYTAVPFLMLLLFPLGLIFGQLGINMAFPE